MDNTAAIKGMTKFSFNTNDPAHVASKLESAAREENHLFERNNLIRKRTDLQLQRQDRQDQHDKLAIRVASAKAHLSAAKKSDEDYNSLKNGLAVAKRQAKELKTAIGDLDEKIAVVEKKIDENLNRLKNAIDAEIGRNGRAAVKSILERAAGDAMQLCGELKAKVEAFEKYREGLTADAAAELDRLSEGAEAIWQSVQKI